MAKFDVAQLGRGLVAVMALWSGAAFAAEPAIKIATLEGGTVNWELETIKAEGLDVANGFTLDVLPVAGNPASQIALQSGEVDAIVSDWFWVARMRAEGEDFQFIPYSKAVGGLQVGAQSPVQTLSDLRGKKIGIAGGPLDKSWLVLRAYAQQEAGFDLAGETEQVFGAPPLIMEAGLSGEVDGVINFWHFMAKQEAAGMRTIVTVAEAASALGLDPETPLLGYVVRGEWVAEHPELAAGLAAASRGAKSALATDPAAFERIRPMMRAKTDAQFDALKAGYIAGIPAMGAVDEAAAGKMLALMAELGGEELVGKATTLPAGVFLSN